MPATRRMKDVLAARASGNFAGRERELAVLMDCAAATGPALAWVHGVAGIGKTALLREFSSRAAALGCTVLSLDCRFIEPSPETFLAGLQRCSARRPARWRQASKHCRVCQTACWRWTAMTSSGC